MATVANPTFDDVWRMIQEVVEIQKNDGLHLRETERILNEQMQETKQFFKEQILETVRRG
ncbi:hypothetical protein TI05_19035 [Achromatium sp. WMS3]|nr:hypothetical protein TI05_19035 [Achromatium sp. WMS3]